MALMAEMGVMFLDASGGIERMKVDLGMFMPDPVQYSSSAGWPCTRIAKISREKNTRVSLFPSRLSSLAAGFPHARSPRFGERDPSHSIRNPAGNSPNGLSSQPPNVYPIAAEIPRAIRRSGRG